MKTLPLLAAVEVRVLATGACEPVLQALLDRLAGPRAAAVLAGKGMAPAR